MKTKISFLCASIKKIAPLTGTTRVSISGGRHWKSEINHEDIFWPVNSPSHPMEAAECSCITAASEMRGGSCITAKETLTIHLQRITEQKLVIVRNIYLGKQKNSCENVKTI